MASAWNEIESPGKLLRARLKRLQEKNPRFSLRAFAKFLGLSPAYLSHVMSGRKTLTAETAGKVADKLNLSPPERKFFLMMQALESAPPDLRAALLPKAEALLTRLNARVVRPTSDLSNIDWPHLLLLVSLEFRPRLTDAEIKSFAGFAGVAMDRVKELVVELETAGFLTRKGRAYHRTARQLVLASAPPNKTLKRMHLEYLRRLPGLVEKRPTERRFSVTEFFRMAAPDFPAAREKASDFLDDLSQQSVKSPGRGVMELALHLNYFDEEEIFSRS